MVQKLKSQYFMGFIKPPVENENIKIKYFLDYYKLKALIFHMWTKNTVKGTMLILLKVQLEKEPSEIIRARIKEFWGPG